VLFTSQAHRDGLSERQFSLGDIPGVLWTPTPPLPEANLRGPGRHAEVPSFEAETPVRFFTSHPLTLAPNRRREGLGRHACSFGIIAFYYCWLLLG